MTPEQIDQAIEESDPRQLAIGLAQTIAAEHPDGDVDAVTKIVCGMLVNALFHALTLSSTEPDQAAELLTRFAEQLEDLAERFAVTKF